MNVIDYFELPEPARARMRIRLGEADWRAAAYLKRLLEQDGLRRLCGPSTRLLLGMEGERLAAFCTLAEKDEIGDTELSPWIGFVYTYPEYRGQRRSGELIERACALAREAGCRCVHISTDHVGLYEKYGFEYLATMKERHGGDTRVYRRRLFAFDE